MTSLRRTAYPRFRARISKAELEDIYTPTPEELAFVARTARDDPLRLNLLLQLKSFQRLGYFPRLTEIPRPVVEHIRTRTGLALADTAEYDYPRTRYRHRAAIRAYLGVKPYQEGGDTVAEEVVARAAQTMGDPADLINAAVEELVRARYELPAFSRLDRLVGRIRTAVNTSLQEKIAGRLTKDEKELLDHLPELSDLRSRTDFTVLKEPAGRASLTHMRQMEARLRWMEGLVDTERLLADVSPAKIDFYAREARAYEPFFIRRLEPARRATLLLCLLHQAQRLTRDNLVEMLIRRVAVIHSKAEEALAELQAKQRTLTEGLIEVLSGILQRADQTEQDAALGQAVRRAISEQGGTQTLLGQCETVTAYRGNNYLPLMWRFYRPYRRVLFDLVDILEIRSPTQDASLLAAFMFIRDKRDLRRAWREGELALDFAAPRWRRLIIGQEDGQVRYHRRHLEVCVFAHLAAELKSGDLYVVGSENYADYREQLLPWEACESLAAAHCQSIGVADDARGFVQEMRSWLREVAATVDAIPPEESGLYFHKGKPRLRRVARQPIPDGSEGLRHLLADRMPERKLLDVLSNVEHWVSYTAHFGPASGSAPKLKDAVFRHIMTTFSYGCNLGPSQTARHARGAVSDRALAFANRQHITTEKLEVALREVVNYYNRFDLPRFWGTGKTAAADGTQFDLLQDNLLAERHIRYGGYGGIAYHHISDKYIALFSHFIACGVWEAVYIIDGLLKNTSDIQPDTVHADTQGQAAPVFGLAYLLGIQLMPRIRNWQRLNLYRPDRRTRFQHIGPLFSGTIDWQLLETHWQDLMQVVISIKAGKLMPSMVLRKLGNYSQKNRLYRAFRELGRVVRTAFLLKYISDMALRRRITATTNKVESYHGFSKWCFFGGHGVIAHNDPVEQEKRIKYNDLVANALILQNVVDMTKVLRELAREGHAVNAETLATLSPYLTGHIRRFGDYMLDIEQKPEPVEFELPGIS